MARYSMKHMKTFCTVVECGGFVSAQTALGMSQPAISTHIRDFEIRLGFQLCQRGRSGFSLTEKGELVYEKCRNMLNNLSDFEADLGELRNKLTGSLRVGLIDSTITNPDFPINQALQRFFSRENDVAIKLEILPLDVLERELLNGHLHIAIGPFQRSDAALSYQLLHREEHRFYCGKHHPLFSMPNEQVHLETLKPYPVSTRTYLQSSELPESIQKGLVASMEAQAMLITSGQFLGFLPVHYAQLWVERGEMRAIEHLGLTYFSDFYLAMRTSPAMRHIVKVFMQDIKDVLNITD